MIPVPAPPTCITQHHESSKPACFQGIAGFLLSQAVSRSRITTRLRKLWNAGDERTPSQAGMAVPKPVAESIADALRTCSAMRRVGTVITTDSGGETFGPTVIF